MEVYPKIPPKNDRLFYAWKSRWKEHGVLGRPKRLESGTTGAAARSASARFGNFQVMAATGVATTRRQTTTDTTPCLCADATDTRKYGEPLFSEDVRFFCRVGTYYPSRKIKKINNLQSGADLCTW